MPARKHWFDQQQANDRKVAAAVKRALAAVERLWVLEVLEIGDAEVVSRIQEQLKQLQEKYQPKQPQIPERTNES